MAEAATVLFWVGAAASTVSTLSEASAQAQVEHRRERQLKLEKKSAELAAMQEENDRLRELTEVNAEAIASTGILDPFSSPSLLALRKANMKTAQKDVRNIYTNLALERAKISAAIAISRKNRHAIVRGGILKAVSILATGGYTQARLGDPDSTTAFVGTGSKTGGGASKAGVLN